MTLQAEDPRLVEAKAIPIEEVAGRLGVAGLHRTGDERVGPCPVCGGKDRFSINTRLGVFNCRGECGGGDGIKLVQLVNGLGFRDALRWLVGELTSGVDPDEAARRRRRAEDQARRREADAARRRREAIETARRIWAEGHPPEETPVRAYLARRGLGPDLLPRLPQALRYHPDLPYMARAGSASWVEIHRGPAMLGGILAPDGALTGVHRTWIDLDQPKGKARITHDGEAMPAKKVWGSKKGGAIRFSDRRRPTLIMGEGIETTLTAAAARAVRAADFWCGIDLGNMAGRRITRGEGMKYAGVPDLEDGDAFLPPPWVEHLVFVQDGDSDPRLTRAKLLSGLRRARARVASVRRISIVHAGEGRDMNDILLQEGEE